jgi:hypothetical protein
VGHIRKLKLVLQRQRMNAHGQEGQVVCRIDLGRDDGAVEVVVEEREECSMLKVWWGTEVSSPHYVTK